MAIRKHIPNAITSCNLLSGVVGLVFAFCGRFDIAFFLMLAAALFDFCDGLAARLLNAPSPIGRELDSLSDLVSFGVLPAVLLAMLGLGGPAVAENGGLLVVLEQGWPCRTLTGMLPLLLAVFSGLRLAKFNVDERQHTSFLGLPTPACAIVCGSLAAYCYFRPESWIASACGNTWFILVVAALLCFLLVCEIPFFALKFGTKSEGSSAAETIVKMKRIALLSIGAISIILTCVLGWNWTAVPLLVFASYILENIILFVFRV